MGCSPWSFGKKFMKSSGAAFPKEMKLYTVLKRLFFQKAPLQKKSIFSRIYMLMT